MAISSGWSAGIPNARPTDGITQTALQAERNWDRERARARRLSSRSSVVVVEHWPVVDQLDSCNSSARCRASVDQVWKVWSDTSTWAKWNPDVLSVSLDAPFATGTTGEMRTKAGGTHRIRLERVEPGRRFQLETKVLPASAFSFQCEVAPLGAGSRISQAIAIRGLLGPVLSAMMGERIASSFVPLLDGLANYAETTPSP